METMKLKKGQAKDYIVSGTGVHVTKIVTGDKALTGYFSAVASSNSGGLTRRMWFSEKPGGSPLEQSFVGNGEEYNPANAEGNEIKLMFTTGEPANSMQCKLEKNHTYYLNEMSKYTGWAIKLKNGKYMNDSTGNVGPALYPNRREAREVWGRFFVKGEAVVVRVTVTVRECS